MIRKPNIENLDISIYLDYIWNLLNEDERNYLRENIQIKSYKKKEIIHSEGENSLYIMCLFTGKVKIHKVGTNGKNQIIRMVKPLEYFGYRAAFAEEPYNASAVAFETSIVCLIPTDIFMKLMENNSKLAIYFIRKLSANLGLANQRTINLTQKHIRGRLADSLLFLKDSYGVEDDGYTLNIYLSREDLANLSNMTTSNAIRTLSNFASERLVATDGRKIKILDEEKLKRVSHLG